MCNMAAPFAFVIVPVLLVAPVAAPVIEKLERYSCCRGPDIALNLSCQNFISINNTNLVYVSGSHRTVDKPFVLDGDKIKVDECVDFLLKIVCDDDGYDEEQKTWFKSDPCPGPVPSSTSVLSQGSALFLLVALILGLVIVECC